MERTSMDGTPAARDPSYESITTMESVETVPREGSVRAVRRPLPSPGRLVPPPGRRRRDGPRDRLGGVHPALGPLDERVGAPGFLYVTAANLVRDHWRKLERERRAVRRVSDEVAVRPQNEQADPSVRLLVQSLPERLRVPILLHYYADMPIREVSALTGRKEGTVKADLHAAREMLRAHLRRSLDHTL